MKISIIKLVIFSFEMFFLLATSELFCNDKPEEKGDRTSYGLLGGLSYAYSNSNISQSELIYYAIHQSIDYPIRLNDNKMNYYGLSVGGAFQYRLGPENNTSVTANIYYSRLSGYYNSGINDLAAREMLIGDLDNQEKLLDYTNERTFHFLVFETSYRLHLSDTPLYLDIGSVFGILLSNNETGKIRINSNDPGINFKDGMEAVRFEDNKRTLVINDRALNKEEMQILRTSINIGIGYRIDYESTVLVPFINYNFGLSTIAKNDDSRLHIFSVGAQLYLGSF